MLLQDANRLSEAEPLIRRALEIFLLFTRRTGHEDPLAPEPLEILQEAMGQANERPRSRLARLPPYSAAQRAPNKPPASPVQFCFTRTFR